MHVCDAFCGATVEAACSRSGLCQLQRAGDDEPNPRGDDVGRRVVEVALDGRDATRGRGRKRRGDLLLRNLASDFADVADFADVDWGGESGNTLSSRSNVSMEALKRSRRSARCCSAASSARS